MEETILFPRIEDAIRLCENSSFPKFVGFLTMDERGEIQKRISKVQYRVRNEIVKLYGASLKRNNKGGRNKKKNDENSSWGNPTVNGR